MSKPLIGHFANPQATKEAVKKLNEYFKGAPLPPLVGDRQRVPINNEWAAPREDASLGEEKKSKKKGKRISAERRARQLQRSSPPPKK